MTYMLMLSIFEIIGILWNINNLEFKIAWSFVNCDINDVLYIELLID